MGIVMQSHQSKTVLIGEHDAASILNLKVSTLRRWRWSGDGPRFIKLGGAVRYDPADLDQFIDENKVSSTSAAVGE